MITKEQFLFRHNISSTQCETCTDQGDSSQALLRGIVTRMVITLSPQLYLISFDCLVLSWRAFYSVYVFLSCGRTICSVLNKIFQSYRLPSQEPLKAYRNKEGKRQVVHWSFFLCVFFILLFRKKVHTQWRFLFWHVTSTEMFRIAHFVTCWTEFANPFYKYLECISFKIEQVWWLGVC